MAISTHPEDRVEPVFGPVSAPLSADLAFGLEESDRIVPAKTRKKAPAKKSGARKRKQRGGAKGGGLFASLGRGVRFLAYWSVVGLVIAGGLGAAAVGYYTTQLPSTDQWTVPARAANVRVLAANGTLISNRADTAGVSLSLDELPPYLPEAVMAIEDRRFYWHFGIDPIGLARAMLVNWRAGRIVQGGSTLTQQLAKNLFLKPDRTMSRKLQEVVLAGWLEWRLSKQEILELYLNRVYLGAGAYGVDAAAHRYFGKSARYLTLAEAATLAGMLKAPATYSPITNPERSAGRAATVLMAMHDTGYISSREASLALSADTGAVADVASGSGRYVLDWVLDQLPGYIGVPEEDIIVTTTIDLRLQDAAARAVTGTLAELGEEKQVSQGALVAIDTQGAVRALVGGRDYAESQFNRAVDAKRQPGSAFKPFVYLTALEHGLVPESMRIDQPISVGGWQPENYAREYRGPVTLQTALALSLNTISAQLAVEYGPDRVAATARRLGVSSPLLATPSIALGTSEVSPLELTAAYVPFSNGGRGVIPHVVRRIETSDGEILFQRSGSGPGQVVDPVQVGMMNAMLTDTLVRGTGKRAQIAGWPAAGKTGTSQEFRDAWFVGYTGVMTAGVWFGNDDNTPTNRASGGNLPAIAWQRFMSEALEGTTVADLPGSYIGLPATAPRVVEALSHQVPVELTEGAGPAPAGGAPMVLLPSAQTAPERPGFGLFRRREVAGGQFRRDDLAPPADLGGANDNFDRGGLLRRLFGG